VKYQQGTLAADSKLRGKNRVETILATNERQFELSHEVLDAARVNVVDLSRSDPGIASAGK
jgi:hypothetical protein